MRDSDRQFEFPAAYSQFQGRRGDKRRSLQASWWARACAAVVLCAAAAIGSAAQTFRTLLAFNGVDGSHPEVPLVQASTGGLFGTTLSGGAGGAGSVYTMTPSGTLKNLYTFCTQQGCPDGQYPDLPLLQGNDGDLYGVAEQGGPNQKGTIFTITPAGVFTTLYSFCTQSNCSDGANPASGLIQGIDESLYGVTSYGGTYGRGTVFKITPGGALTVLHSFNITDGFDPSGRLIQGVDGNFYGATAEGGSNYAGGNVIGGTIFKMTAAGALTTLYDFCAQSDCADGQVPDGSLVQASDGNFYGATYYGGANLCSQTSWGCGTIFRITPAGTLTTLLSFDSTNGSFPYALIHASDGNYYGTTYMGGSQNEGTVFEISSDGTLNTLHDFCRGTNCNQGWGPGGALVRIIHERAAKCQFEIVLAA